MTTIKYRLSAGVKFRKVNNKGEITTYQGGISNDVVEMTPEEASRYAPGRITPVVDTDTTARELVEKISDSTSPMEVRAIRSAEQLRDNPRSTVITAADKRLKELEVNKISGTTGTTGVEPLSLTDKKS